MPQDSEKKEYPLEELHAHRDKWLEIGFSTQRIDKDRARAATAKMYECAELSPPPYYIFADNPLQGAIMAAILPGIWDKIMDRMSPKMKEEAKAGKSEAWEKMQADLRAMIDKKIIEINPEMKRGFEQEMVSSNSPAQTG